MRGKYEFLRNRVEGIQTRLQIKYQESEESNSGLESVAAGRTLQPRCSQITARDAETGC